MNPPSLPLTENLEDISLDLTGNRISQHGCAELGMALCCLASPCLVRLDLSLGQNRLRDLEILQLRPALQALGGRLKELGLHLCSNQLTLDGLSHLCHNLGEMLSLQRLTLSGGRWMDEPILPSF